MQNGANLSSVKDHNQALVLQLIRASDGISRVEIADRIGLTAQTASNIVNRLLAQGLILEAGRFMATTGKSRVRFRVNPSGGYAIGIRIGRTHLVVAAIDLNGHVVAGSTRPTDHAIDPAAIADILAMDVADVVARAGIAPDRLFGIGVAAPGPLDHETGVILDPPYFPGWSQIPIRRMLSERTGAAVVLDYNAKAAAAWERWTGSARRVDDFAFIYGSTGVGAGLFIRGELLRGQSGTAGAFGHLGIDPDGLPCACGSRGCLERYCSVPAIVERYQTVCPGPVTFDEIERLVLAGDPPAAGVVERAAALLGYGIISLVNLTDIGLIVLGGRLFDVLGSLFVDRIQQILDTQAYGSASRRIRVLLSAATGDPGAVGAAALVLHTRFGSSPGRLVVDGAMEPAVAGAGGGPGR